MKLVAPQVGSFWKIKQGRWPFLILDCIDDGILFDCQCLFPNGKIRRKFLDCVYYEPHHGTTPFVADPRDLQIR